MNRAQLARSRWEWALGANAPSARADGAGVPYKPHGYVQGVRHYCNDRYDCPARVPGDYHVRPDGSLYWGDDGE